MAFTIALLNSPHYAAVAMPLQIPSFDPFHGVSSLLKIQLGCQQKILLRSWGVCAAAVQREIWTPPNSEVSKCLRKILYVNKVADYFYMLKYVLYIMD